jgi:MoaA/NifB/PqqE/SkfB family radical SAM enzyme
LNMKFSLAHLTFLRNIRRSIRRGLPYKLLSIVTFRCNSRCSTCNNWQLKPEVELSTGEMADIFRKMPFPISWLAITGGEPFLRDDLVDIIASARENIPSLLMVSLVSNGLLTEKITTDMKRLLELKIPFLFLRFSLDGPEEVHNAIRNVPDAYNQTMNTYSRVYEMTKGHHEVNLGFEVTLSKLNAEALETFLPGLLREYKANITIAHRGFLYHNTEGTAPPLTPDLASIRKILRHQEKILNPFSASDLIQKRYLREIPAYLGEGGAFTKKCVAFLSSLGIDPYGNVVPCLMWERKLGNLRDVEYDMAQLWKSQEKERIVEEIARGACPRCWTPCEAYQTILNELIS